MARTVLSVEDFETLQTFQSRVHPESVNYQVNVIRLFRELFGWNLTAYSKWSKNQNVHTLHTDALDEDYMRECHDRLLQDDVFHTYSEYINSNAWDGVFFSQDAISPDTEESDLLTLLHSRQIYYFVTMLISQEPREHYVFYKTRKEGPFTEREKKILHYLQQFLSSCAAINKALTRETDSLRVICQQMDREGKGFVIIDESQNVVSHNESIFRFAPKGRDRTQINMIVQNLIQILEEKNGILFEDWRGKIHAETGGYLVTADEFSVQSFDRSRSSFYMLCTTPAYYRDMQFHYNFCKDYQLTEREAQIAELIVKGMPNKAIADALYLSLSTVKVHIGNIYRKLQVHNRMGVVEKMMKINK